MKLNLMETRLQNFLIDDLKKVEYHIQKLISYTQYTHYKEYKEDIEEIEKFFSYWEQHSKIITKTKLK